MSHSLDSLMLALSAAGRTGAVWVVIILAGAAVGRLRGRMVLRAFLSLVLALVVAEAVLKPLVHEPRPFELNPAATVIGARPGGYAFPSGHATSSFAAAVALSQAWPAGRIAWLALAALISYSRVYLGVHSWFDVLAGAVLGAACGYLAIAVGRRSPAS